jgi:hypothetical protein
LGRREVWVSAFCDRDGFVFRSLDGQATLYYCITEREKEKERKEKEKREEEERGGGSKSKSERLQRVDSLTHPTTGQRSQTCWANFF